MRREFLLPEGWKDRELILEIGNLNGAGKLFLNDGLLGEIVPSNAATRFGEVSIPRELLRDGSTHLVIGRPILGAADKRAAAEAIRAEMRAVLSGKTA